MFQFFEGKDMLSIKKAVMGQFGELANVDVRLGFDENRIEIKISGKNSIEVKFIERPGNFDHSFCNLFIAAKGNETACEFFAEKMMNIGVEIHNAYSGCVNVISKQPIEDFLRLLDWMQCI